MTTKTHIHTNKLLIAITAIWDWPFTKGIPYSEEERAHFKEISQYLSLLFAIILNGVFVFIGSSAVFIIFASLSGALLGHYIAGLIIALLH